MKRLFLLVIVTVAMWGATAKMPAQITAADVFVNAPVGIFPLVDRNTRLDMIDYFRSGSTTSSTNRLSGKARVTELGNDNMAVDMTEASSYQLALLPMGSDTIIALIKTVKTPSVDSRLSFYTTGWDKIDRNLFENPVLDDWLTKEGERNRKEAESLIPFVMSEYRYDAEAKELRVMNSMRQFFSEDEYNAVGPYMKTVLTYRWNGKKMKPVK